MENSPRIRRVDVPIFGVGNSDSKFTVMIKRGGKTYFHTAYEGWRLILARCYKERDLARFPTYSGCYVCDEWLSFMGFYKWWKVHFIRGYQLDKDILSIGNKIYSPDHCLYIPGWLNTFAASVKSKNSDLPTGVTFVKGKYRARIAIDRKVIWLGEHDSAEDAHDAWLKKKIEVALSYKPFCDSIHPLLHDGLMKKVLSMRRLNVTDNSTSSDLRWQPLPSPPATNHPIDTTPNQYDALGKGVNNGK